MWQGGESASGGSYNGTQKSLGIISGNPQADLAGKTIGSVTIRLAWTHTWYNNGAYVALGYTGYANLGPTWGGGGITAVKTWWQGQRRQRGHQGPDRLRPRHRAAVRGGPVHLDRPRLGSFNLNYYGSVYGAGGSNSVTR